MSTGWPKGWEEWEKCEMHKETKIGPNDLLAMRFSPSAIRPWWFGQIERDGTFEVVGVRLPSADAVDRLLAAAARELEGA